MHVFVISDDDILEAGKEYVKQEKLEMKSAEGAALLQAVTSQVKTNILLRGMLWRVILNKELSCVRIVVRHSQ